MADTNVSKASRGPQYWPDREGSRSKTLPIKATTEDAQPGIGPQEVDEYGGVNDPPNRSEQIFKGLPLPILLPQDQVQRRDFSIPIKPTLRYYEGVDGAAETVVNRRVITQPTHLDGPSDHAGGKPERGADAGKDPNKYAENPNDAYTLNGIWIRGT